VLRLPGSQILRILLTDLNDRKLVSARLLAHVMADIPVTVGVDQPYGSFRPQGFWIAWFGAGPGWIISFNAMTSRPILVALMESDRVRAVFDYR
jgi:hypothetical protein